MTVLYCNLLPSVCGILRSGLSGTLQHCGRREEKEVDSNLAEAIDLEVCLFPLCCCGTGCQEGAQQWHLGQSRGFDLSSCPHGTGNCTWGKEEQNPSLC